jgi:type IV pilus assembly protein PilC
MAILTSSAPKSTKKKITFAEKKAPKKKIKLQQLTVFTQQLSAMLEAGITLVSALEAIQEQTQNPIFRIIIRNVKNEVSAGRTLSEACADYPRAFPKMFVSMVQAGEASGGLAEILDKTSVYFEETVKLIRKVKGALTYLAIIPVFAGMFEEFDQELPKPTLVLIGLSSFMKSNFLFLLIGMIGFFFFIKHLIATPKGRIKKDQLLAKIPVIGDLIRKVSLSRFCRTYAILIRAGVPILQTLDIVRNASSNTYVEKACTKISKQINQGGQLSDVLIQDPYFPPMIRHMTRAGEQTGNVDGMMTKVADFYDSEVDTLVAALTSLMEPLLICFLGFVIGGIVIAMFLPIFNLSSVIQ